ncbi:hypothetical protein M2137_003058 [Parabacteroides sp. PFB2-10]|nr:hypothetical protein [Parabacteroides sp. PFB2-10]
MVITIKKVELLFICNAGHYHYFCIIITKSDNDAKYN